MSIITGDDADNLLPDPGGGDTLAGLRGRDAESTLTASHVITLSGVDLDDLTAANIAV